ncbi:DUF11 domain-containing protein [Actinokineospora cianjurensis]|uniref:Putative repeat protein (TIGR01451 family) n=1 Tax=Actinokineospora cianjurensis TaxID=585224 RepID=A0A421B2G4_9PSEU|nr:DUF11 domain-containing protein [Actinokineospora cianjurensis]RLK58567.1 putative repeat protein (TIGR01451 family) [Actinokineospora cianjurensis]
MGVRRSRLLVLLTVLGVVAAGVVAPMAEAVPPGPAVGWGRNGQGQLGQGTVVNSQVPASACAVGAAPPCAPALDNATAVAAGALHTLWLLADGTVVAAGLNDQSQLGDGTTTQRDVPVRVCAVGAAVPCTSFLSGVAAIAAGENHSLALLSDGSVVAWGNNNQGQLGNGAVPTDSAVPVRVCAVGAVVPCASFLTGVTAIAAGGFDSVAVSGGVAHTWGDNGDGHLGNGAAPTDSAVPVRVCAVGATAPCTSFLSGVTAIAAGEDHMLALAGGVVHAWGDNDQGELGNGAKPTDSAVPVRVCAEDTTAPCASFLSGVTAIAAGQEHSLALVGGVVHAWGDNNRGQIGNGGGADRVTPTRVCAVGATAPCTSYLSGVIAIAAGERGDHSAALISGGVSTWGANGSGQLGTGTTVDSAVPVRVCATGTTAPCTTFLSGVTAIDAGDATTFAIVAPPAADLAVDLRATAPPLGAAIDYTLTVTNTGPATAGGTITVTLPPAATGATSTSCAYTHATRTATCPITAVAAGTQVTHGLRATFGLLTLNLALAATATRTSSTPADPNPTNDSRTATCTALTSLLITC